MKPHQGTVQIAKAIQHSTRVHSGYTRHPQDFTIQEKRVRLHLNVRRFFCPNPDCPRTTFAEQVPDFLLRYARRSNRVTERWLEIALSSGFDGVARLCKKLGFLTSGDTLLRIARRLILPERSTPRVLGIDDWAWRKGIRYGTILVDLETHQVVDLLPDREADRVVDWLQHHPGIGVISRDRGTIYAQAATRGAPDAIQVADRWHLLENLTDAVEQVLGQHRAVLSITLPEPKPISKSTQPVPDTANSAPPQADDPSPPALTKRAAAQLRSRTERLALYSRSFCFMTVAKTWRRLPGWPA